jgi:hypothetical protein
VRIDGTAGRLRRALPALAVLLPAGLLFLLHALLFGSWIVDDAGISFAYARNLASGHGLVAQPGVPPVEGFSNPLWVLLLTPALVLRLFDPVLTPKALALALTAVSFLLLYRSLAGLTGSRLAAALPPVLLALDTSFVAWSVSGLENPLYAVLLVLLFWLLARERQAGPSPRRALFAGAIAAGIALTRPDGSVFLVLYPLLTLFVDRGSRALGRIAAYAAASAGLFGGYLAFRFLYFGDLVPNTFHAKGAPMRGILSALLTFEPAIRERIADLLHSVAGRAGVPLAAALLAGTVLLAARRRFRWLHGALLAFTAMGALPFLLLPADWMTEYRFATPFHLFFFPWAVSVVHSLGTMLAERFPRMVLAPERRRLPVAAAVLLTVGWGLSVFLPRSILFAASPTVPFAEVEEDYGRRYNHFADLLGVRSGSILLPDIGGTLWVSRLRVYDLAGLIDPTIARTREADHRAFYDYVFETVKPTFIHTHHYWTLLSGFDLDPRLQRDYLPLHQRVERWVVELARGIPLRSGDYVRRDAAAGHEDAIQAIRQELIDHYARQDARAMAGPQGPGPGSLR